MPDDVTGLKINVVPNLPPEIGADTQKTFLDDIIGAAQVGALDVSALGALSHSAQNREQTYELLDEMAQDSRIASVLECYAGDITQPNDRGKIVWAEGDDVKINEYTNWLLETLNVDKHIYKWAYCLVTYGDVYLRLFRQSDVDDDLLFKKSRAEDKPKTLNEDVKLRIYGTSDKYIPYVKMIDNPGEIFDLQKFGKTHGYIKAPTRVLQTAPDELYSYVTRYKTKESDVEVFDALSYVHGCLEATNQRQPETIDVFLDNRTQQFDYDSDERYTSQDALTSSYDVKRGQSVLFNSFKTWRELNLLELSALLNRLTRSALVRIMNIDVGDMPRSQVEIYLSKLKEKIEQKAALHAGKSLTEFNLSGPIDNTIYVPVHEGKGSINATSIGGDFDPKSLVDLEYFKNMLYGSLRVPKQFFSETDDSTGFNAGSSLTIISARYGKEIKKYQNILCQMITDLINLFLIDRGLDNYVNKFSIRMQTPITQEELDRRTNNDTRLRYISDVMTQLEIIEDPLTKLRVYCTMISQVINDPEIINILQGYIDKVQREADDKLLAEAGQPAGDNSSDQDIPELDFDFGADTSAPSETPEEEPSEPVEAQEAINTDEDDEDKEILNEDADDQDEHLPSPEELGINLLDDNE